MPSHVHALIVQRLTALNEKVSIENAQRFGCVSMTAGGAPKTDSSFMNRFTVHKSSVCMCKHVCVCVCLIG